VASAPARRIVRRELVESLDALLLGRLLSPWALYLASRKIGVGALATTPNDSVRKALYELFARGDASMPEGLRQTLVDLGAVATPDGHDAILEVAKEGHLPLPPLGLHVADFALAALLDHPALFAGARLRVACSAVSRFVEFEPKTIAGLDALRDERRVAAARRAVSDYFASRNRTSFSEILVVETPLDVLVEVTHGESPRSHGVLEKHEHASEIGRTVKTLVLSRRDHVVVDRETGRLAVNARYPGEKDLYRRVIGELLTGDPDHFGPFALIRLEALRADLDAALSHDGISGLLGIELRGLSLATDDGYRATHAVPTCLAKRFGAPGLDALLRDARVRKATLALTLEGRAKPLRIELTAPNGLVFDRTEPDVERVARAYLVARGLLAKPMARAQPTTA